MKPIKTGLRVLFSAASLFSFLVGWIFFAHANKPAPLTASQPAQASALPTPAPVRPQRRQPSLQLVPSQRQAQPQFFQPLFRTGGS